MNISRLNFISIEKVIAHEIHPKTSQAEAYPVHNDNLLDFEDSEKNFLVNKIQDSFSNTKKTFQLVYEDFSEESLFKKLKEIKSYNEQDFISFSKDLADKMAESHFRTKIPGGYCLIGTGKTNNNKMFFFVIKAELQEVCNITNNSLKIIKDVFLSPAKEFYKLGLFIEDGNEFIPYMYDDQFSPQKKDLTEYFYGKFLGLTTDENDKLKSKNFFDDTKAFIESNIRNVKDKIGLLDALKVVFREDTSGIISAKKFSEEYFEGSLKELYEKKIVNPKYPLSFTKNLDLIDNKLDFLRVSIPLTFFTSLVGSAAELNNIEIVDEPTSSDIKELQPEIDNGTINKIVILRQAKDKL